MSYDHLQRGITGTFSVPPGHPVADPGGGIPPIRPRCIHQASKHPLRVVVRNISPLGQAILVSYDKTGLTEDNAFPSNAFVVPAGVSETFVLLPGEALYGVTPGVVPGMVSYLVNVAFPFELKAG